MNRSGQNSAHALNMVVSAPLDDCLTALYNVERRVRLMRGCFFVKTQRLERDLYRYEIMLRMTHAKSPMNKILRGTLRYNRDKRATIVTGEISAISFLTIQNLIRLEVLILVLSIPVTLIYPESVVFGIGSMLWVLFAFWLSNASDAGNAQRVIKIAKEEFRLIAPKKGHPYAGLNGDESPFYDEDEYQSLKIEPA